MKKITKLLLTIPLITTPFFLCSCKSKDIEKIGKEVGSRINGENQILIEKLNKIIDEQRKKINSLQFEIDIKKSEIERRNEEYRKLEKKY
jgi:flagellar motility protein MotE (MotC chaperone)